MENNFWNSKQGESLIKLLMWLFFIVIIYLVLTFGFRGSDSAKNTEKDNNNNNNNEVIEDVFDSTFFDIRSSNYEYSYNITINNENYVYNGSIIDNKDTGYKETKDGIIRYEKQDNEFYQVNMDNKTLITDFYGNLQTEFLDYNVLYSIISEFNCQNKTCEFDYNGYKGMIAKIDDTSFNISIYNDNEKYDLEYKVEL